MNLLHVIIGSLILIAFIVWAKYAAKNAIEYPENFEDGK